MCEVLVFDVVCDKKSDADTLVKEFASLGMNVSVQRQNAIFGAGKRACEAEPLKQEAIYRVSVTKKRLKSSLPTSSKRWWQRTA